LLIVEYFGGQVDCISKALVKRLLAQIPGVTYSKPKSEQTPLFLGKRQIPKYRPPLLGQQTPKTPEVENEQTKNINSNTAC